MRVLFILLVLCCVGCTHTSEEPPGSSLVLCDDGRKVVDAMQCDTTAPEPSAESSGYREPDITRVNETHQNVFTAEQAHQAFEAYAANTSYRFVSSEAVTRAGIEYYRIKYRHNISGGGNRYVLVDNEGTIYEELGIV